MIILPSKRIIIITKRAAIIQSNKGLKSPRIEKNQVLISPRIIKKSPRIILTKAVNVVIKVAEPPEPEKQAEPVSYESLTALLTELVSDSKENLVTQKEDCPYFIDSKNFLMNKNRLLEYYLGHINNIDVSRCVKQLYEYATTGYLKEREAEMLKKEAKKKS